MKLNLSLILLSALLVGCREDGSKLSEPRFFVVSNGTEFAVADRECNWVSGNRFKSKEEACEWAINFEAQVRRADTMPDYAKERKNWNTAAQCNP
jgi:hypothetical protein